MWLLDHNIPVQLKPALLSENVPCDTTRARGWDKLQNGELVATSFAAGFRCILTRDVRFRAAAAHTFKSYPEMAIVLIRLPQRRASFYVQEFLRQWKVNPIKPISGAAITWP